MQIENIFPTGILSHDVDSKLADKIENLITPRLHSLENSDNTQTDFYKEKIISLSEIPLLVNEIYQCQKFYSKNTDFFYTKGISSYWVQDYNSSSFHTRHNHGKSQYSVIYWVRAENNPGLLVMHNPNPFISLWNPISKGPLSYHTHSSIPITPKKGRIILFPSYLDHEVLKGGDNCIRTTIAFNLN